jgi:tetratricopeptide (TPR) repeat protein
MSRTAVLLAFTALVAVTVSLAVVYERGRRAEVAESERARAAEAERNEAARQRDEAAASRDRTAVRFRLARGAVDEFYTQGSQDPELKTRSLATLRPRLLGSAVQFYEKLAKTEGTDPETRVERGRACRHLGTMYAEAGQKEKAATAFQQAVTVQQRLVAQFRGEQAYRYELARTYLDHARAYQSHRHWERSLAEPAIRDAELAPGMLRQLLRSDPKNPQYRYDLVQSLDCVADLIGSGDGACEEALAVSLGLTREYPQNESYRRLLAATYNQLARAADKGGRYDEAAEFCAKGIPLVKRLAGRPPNDPADLALLTELLAHLTIARAKSGKVADALETARESTALAREAADAHSAIPDFQLLANRCQERLALLCEWDGRKDLAEAAWLEVIGRREKLAREVPDDSGIRLDLARSQHALGVLLRDAGRTVGAQRHFKESQKGEEAALRLAAADPAGPSELRWDLRELALELRKTDPERAVAMLARVKALGVLESLRHEADSREKLAAAKPADVTGQFELGQALYELGMVYQQIDPARSPALFERAEAALRTALAGQEKVIAADPYFTVAGRVRANIRQALALVLLARGDRVGAVAEADAMVGADDGGEARYAAAYVLTRVSAASRGDARLSEDEQAEMAEYYAKRAAGLLDEMRRLGRGFVSPKKLNTIGVDDAPLPRRDDFKQLLGPRRSSAVAPAK